jgi:hypothetical protein
MKKSGMLLLLLATLCGCGPSVSNVSFVKPDIPSAYNFSLLDARPDTERSSQKVEAGPVTLHLLGDDQVSPDVPTLLKAAISQQPQSDLHGQTVVVKSVRVIVESPYSSAGKYDPERLAAKQDAAMIQAATIGYGGAIGGAILVDLIERAFEKANDNTIFTVKVFIDGNVDDRPFAEYAFSTYDSGNGEAQIKEALTEAIDKTANTIVRLTKQ